VNIRTKVDGEAAKVSWWSHRRPALAGYDRLIILTIVFSIARRAQSLSTSTVPTTSDRLGTKHSGGIFLRIINQLSVCADLIMSMRNKIGFPTGA
jgi:hypothetical protein